LDTLLERNRAELNATLETKQHDWAGLMQPLETIEERTHRLWSPVNHLNAVRDSEALRPVHREALMKLTAWQSELAQNESLFAAIRALLDSEGFARLSPERQQAVRHAVRDFRLAGAELADKDKARFRDIQMRLSELGARFEQNVLDATRAFTLHLTDEADLAGLPESVRAAASERARQAGKEGWLFTLDAPSYGPFMQYAEHRELRRRMYRAYVTRASEGRLDNSPLITEILKLRREAAHLLGFANAAEMSLATKMAESPAQVMDFLRELASRGRPRAEDEAAELRDFARAELGLDDMQAWDVAFASERLRRHRFDFSEEDLKPWFPEPAVLNGLFVLAGKLYGIRIEAAEAPVWHPDVRYFEVLDQAGERVAGFYFDPYAREHKRGGAWMDECIIRWRRPDGGLQRPVAHLVCNFERPVGDRPALWTHEEVLTLFHEFGHGLHHMLTRVETLDVSGIRGVPWDAVELPSQFMEHFCWHRESLDMFARHVDSGEPLPDSLLGKMRAARTFQSGLQMLRQIEFALFDMRLHAEFDPDGAQSVQDMLDEVRDEVAVLRPPAFNRFQNSFSHIFAGGYAAGYYSYKWAEVMASDAFAAFEENGIFDAATARRFRDELLAVGGSRDLMQAFIAFRGRKPTVDALLRHAGLLDMK
jgi:oligopeptidase A